METDHAEMEQSTEFAALPRPQRDRVRALLNCLAALPEGGKVTGPGGAISRLAAAGAGSMGNARRLYYLYRDQRRWQVLVDGRSRPAATLVLSGNRSPRFRSWVQTVVEQNQRKTAPAIEQIHTAFLLGNITIPGYEGWEGGSIPPGCSASSLRGLIKRWELDNVRHGVKMNAATQLSPILTREGLKPGQVYEFDDMWHDHLVVMGSEHPRVLEFGAFDVASACYFHWGHIPSIKREEDAKKQGLTQKMFVLFLAYVLRYIGYHPSGCRLIMEHATTNLPERIKLLLTSSIPGLTIDCGSITGALQATIGGYVGQIGGNPRRKAGIENSHSGIHNLLGDLPGQVGKDRQHTQEMTLGRVREQELAEKWRNKLIALGRDDLAALVQNHFVTFRQFSDLLIIKYRLWNGRTHHQLEGWSANTRIEYELTPGTWTPEEVITQGGRRPISATLRAAIGSNPAMVRESRLSPQEVWNRGQGELTRIPLSLYVEMLSDLKHFGREVKVRGALIKVQDKLVSPEPLHYLAELVSPEGRRYQLGEGETVRCCLNPYAPEALVILDPAGRILGEAPLYQRVAHLDDEGLREQMGRVESYNARRLTQQKARWEGETAAARALHTRNRELAAEGGVLGTREAAGVRQIAAPKPAKKAAGKAAALPMSWDCTPPAGLDTATRPRTGHPQGDAAAALASLPSTSRRYRRPSDL